jgi:hypothetical protein
MKKFTISIFLLSAIYQTNAQNTAGFETNSNNDYYIPSGTNVGIGVSDPNNSLEVNGTVETSYLEITNAVGMNDNQIRFRAIWDPNHYLGYQAYFENRLIDGPVLVGNKSGVLGTRMNRGSLNINPVLTWNHTGNVGIGGNFEPNSKLHIRSQRPVLTLESTGFEQGGVFGEGYSSRIEFKNNQTSFQIGTVYRSGQHAFGLQTSQGGMYFYNSQIVFGEKFENGGAVPESDDFVFRGSSKFSENVGIGTHSRDNYKLAVSGRIICEELKVELEEDWPDYVFSDEYELKDLNQLKTEIDSLGHLPNVPSAEMVSQEGIGLGQMTKIQMEKIEEITLYLIQLKSENDAIKEQIRILREQNQLLQSELK